MKKQRMLITALLETAPQFYLNSTSYVPNHNVADCSYRRNPNRQLRAHHFLAWCCCRPTFQEVDVGCLLSVVRVRARFDCRSLASSLSILPFSPSAAKTVGTLPASITDSAKTSPDIVTFSRAMLLTLCDRRRVFGVEIFVFFAARVVFAVATRWRSSLRRSRWRIARQLFVRVPGDPISARWLTAVFSTWTARRAVQSCV